MKARTFIAAFVLLAAGCQPAGQKAPPPAVLAAVNGAPITVQQFKDAFQSIKLGFSNLSGKPASGADAKMDIMSQLIEEEMCLQEAKRVGVTVSEAEVEGRLRRAMSGYTQAAFESNLREAGLDLARYKEGLKRKLTVEKLIDREVYSKVSVDTAQAKRYFDAHKGQFKTPASVRARQIVVASRAEAEAILKELKKGADFAQLARTRSLSPDSASGGDLGYFSHGEMPPQFEAAVSRIKPGGISGVVKTPYGYHIFKVEDVRKAVEPSFKEAEGEVIKELARSQGEDAFEKWLAGLKAGAKIEVNFKLLESM